MAAAHFFARDDSLYSRHGKRSAVAFRDPGQRGWADLYSPGSRAVALTAHSMAGSTVRLVQLRSVERIDQPEGIGVRPRSPQQECSRKEAGKKFASHSAPP